MHVQPNSHRNYFALPSNKRQREAERWLCRLIAPLQRFPLHSDTAHLFSDNISLNYKSRWASWLRGQTSITLVFCARHSLQHTTVRRTLVDGKRLINRRMAAGVFHAGQHSPACSYKQPWDVFITHTSNADLRLLYLLWGTVWDVIVFFKRYSV